MNDLEYVCSKIDESAKPINKIYIVGEGSYDELIQINIIGLHGLGGFTIKETVHYLLGTKESGYVAYNFRSESELYSFKSQLKDEIKRINGGENGIIKMKYVLTNEVGE